VLNARGDGREVEASGKAVLALAERVLLLPALR
jgi:hypothetical protein